MPNQANTKSRVKCACSCGAEHELRAADLLAGNSQMCRSCSISTRMRALPKAERVARAKHASVAAARALQARKNPYKARYGVIEVRRVRSILAGAKTRCTNQHDVAWANYGGRGIEFRFATIRAGVEWVLDNLGPRPSGDHSIDRIDNDGHYEPGNLRWATRIEQARNKRAYKGSVYGHRLQRLLAQRPDYSYEGLRKYIKLGYTDEQILNLRKPAGGRPRKVSTGL